jgi:succinate dehydrogenase flavin-adding protein (antitoxin of CptAB toxin-antitoxin module)
MVQVPSRLIEVRPEIQSKSQEARVYFKSFYGEEDARFPVDLDVKEFDRLLWTRDEDILIWAVGSQASGDGALLRGAVKLLARFMRR